MNLTQENKIFAAGIAGVVLVGAGHAIYSARLAKKGQEEALQIAEEHYESLRVLVRNGRAVAVLPEGERPVGGVVRSKLVQHDARFVDVDKLQAEAPTLKAEPPGGSHVPPPPKAAAEAAPVKNPDPADLGIPNGSFRPTELPE